MSLLTRRNLIVPPWAPLGLDTAVDTFTDADGTDLMNHKPDGGGFWVRHIATIANNAIIENNRLHKPFDANTRFYFHSAIPIDADYDVSCDVVMRSDNNLSTAGPLARAELFDTSHYFARYNTNGNAWELWRNVGVVSTMLGSVGQVLTIDQAYRCTLRCRGPAISVFIDGVEVISVTDGLLVAKGRAGVRLSQVADATTGVHLDNWQAVANNL